MPDIDVTIGIIKEFRGRHRCYVDACRDMAVPYKVLDISGPNWIDVIQTSGCDGFLVRPSPKFAIWKQMYDERLKVMVEELGKTIYPTYNEIWLYESKRRTNYWLQANEIPHPRTWIFYSYEEAKEFAKTAQLPVVYKSDLGSGASGTKIFRKRLPLFIFIWYCFKKKFVRRKGKPYQREWGSVFFQEYLPDVLEWRIVRLGNSYFGHQKLRKSNFHSGSSKVGWYDPPEKLLDFARDVTDKGNFTSMNLDIFETSSGQYLINELHTLFGFAASRRSQMILNGKSGRYLYDIDRRKWRFEEGDFSSDGGFKLRVETFVEMLRNTTTSNHKKIVSMH